MVSKHSDALTSVYQRGKLDEEHSKSTFVKQEDDPYPLCCSKCYRSLVHECSESWCVYHRRYRYCVLSTARAAGELLDSEHPNTQHAITDLTVVAVGDHDGTSSISPLAPGPMETTLEVFCARHVLSSRQPDAL